ncbi:hypothetical protein [Bradyrhizobium sp. 195]|nr:hypothetical protein [Bradyrhizobium sp. 195]
MEIDLPLSRRTLMAAWLLLLVIAVAAIMPHAQERSKRECDADE